jgi:hypothetical protein
VNLTRVLLWAVVILVIAYAFNVNLPVFISGIFHGLQQMHNTQTGH